MNNGLYNNCQHMHTITTAGRHQHKPRFYILRVRTT